MQINGTSMSQLGWASIVNEITVRQLLHMNSGLTSYNNTFIYDATLFQPDWDITPQDYLTLNSKKFEFPPGAKNQYCSINYLILGLIWARFAGAKDWDGLDMLNSLIPSKLRAESPTGYNHTHFFRRGQCKTYSDVVPYFSIQGLNKTTGFPMFMNM